MATALTLKPKEYILVSDMEAPKEEQTIFILKPLTYAERCTLQDGLLASVMAGKKGISDEKVTNVKSGTWEMNTILYGLEKIENLKDPNGALIEYTPKMPTDKKKEVLSRLRSEWLGEVANEIRVISGLAEEEEKN